MTSNGSHTPMVTDYMFAVSDAVRSKGKSFILTPGGGINFALKWLQNWRTVVHNKKADGLIMQGYRRGLKPFQDFVFHSDNLITASRISQPTGLALLAGLSNETVSAADLSDQIKFSRNQIPNWPQGYSVHFFYNATLFRPSPGETRQSRKDAIKNALQVGASPNAARP